MRFRELKFVFGSRCWAGLLAIVYTALTMVSSTFNSDTFTSFLFNKEVFHWPSSCTIVNHKNSPVFINHITSDVFLSIV